MSSGLRSCAFLFYLLKIGCICRSLFRDSDGEDITGIVGNLVDLEMDEEDDMYAYSFL